MRPVRSASRLASGDNVNRQHPLNRGLKGWWIVLPHRGGGLTWYELAGQSNGTLNSFGAGVGWKGSTQRFGSLLCDGSTSYVAVPAAAGVQTLTAFTYSLWVTCTGTTTTTVVSECILGQASALGSYFQIATVSGKGFAQLRDGAAVGYNAAGATFINDGLWHHLTATVDGPNMRLYVDGVQDATVSLAGLTALSASTGVTFSSLRASSQIQYFNGSFDDIRIYQRALPAAEVQALYYESRDAYPTALNWRRNRTYLRPQPFLPPRRLPTPSNPLYAE